MRISDIYQTRIGPVVLLRQHHNAVPGIIDPDQTYETLQYAYDQAFAAIFQNRR